MVKFRFGRMLLDKAMGLLLVLIVNLVMVLGSPGSVHDRKLAEDSSAIDVVKRLLEKNSRLAYDIDMYSIKLDKHFASYVKNIIKEGESEMLKDISMNEVDDILNSAALYNVDVLNFTKVTVGLFGTDLFDFYSSKWSVHNIKGKEHKIHNLDSHYNVQAKRPILKSEDHDVSFEFILGPRFQDLQLMDKKHSDEKENSYDYILMDPYLYISRNGNDEGVEYSILVHSFKMNEYSLLKTAAEKGNTKVLSLIRGISEFITYASLELDFGFTFHHFSEGRVTSLNGNEFDSFAQWIKEDSPGHLLIDLFGATKHFLENHLLLEPYMIKTSIQPKPYESLHDPKRDSSSEIRSDSFKDLPGFLLSRNKRSKYNVQPGRYDMNDNYDERIRQIQNRIQTDGIEDQHLHKWGKWLNNMMEEDFQKYRGNTGNTKEFQPGYNFFNVFKNSKIVPRKDNRGPPFDGESFTNRPKTVDEQQYVTVYCEDEEFEDFEPHPTAGIDYWVVQEVVDQGGDNSDDISGVVVIPNRRWKEPAVPGIPPIVVEVVEEDNSDDFSFPDDITCIEYEEHEVPDVVVIPDGRWNEPAVPQIPTIIVEVADAENSDDIYFPDDITCIEYEEHEVPEVVVVPDGRWKEPAVPEIPTIIVEVADADNSDDIPGVVVIPSRRWKEPAVPKIPPIVVEVVEEEEDCVTEYPEYYGFMKGKRETATFVNLYNTPFNPLEVTSSEVYPWDTDPETFDK